MTRREKPDCSIGVVSARCSPTWLVTSLFAAALGLMGGCSAGAGTQPKADAASGGGGGATAPDGGTGSGGAAAGGRGGTTASGGATVVRQTCVPPPSQDAPVAKLSQTGCVDPARPTMMAASVIPYEVNSPLWSDGADKTRGMALPAGGKIHTLDCVGQPASCPRGVADAGKWVFPVGTVMVKNFLFDKKLVETRLYVRFNETTWVGYSYQWNEAQTDATIVPDDRLKVSFNTGTRTVDWNYPNRLDCNKCHSEPSGWTLGPETAQLNRVVGGMNQIDRFQAMGLFDAPVAKPYKAALVAPYASGDGSPAATATLEQKARSYLHANCGICHRPEGEFADLDLRYDVALKDTKICGTLPARGDFVDNNFVLDPGKPDTSVMLIRMKILADPAGGKTSRMPQIATYVVDQQGATLVSDWIKSITACPQ